MMDYRDENIWLMQGDCLERMKEIEEGGVDLVLTDPPYGTTKLKWDTVIDLSNLWYSIKRVRCDYSATLLFGKEPFSSLLRTSNVEEFKYDWYWNKNTKSNFPQASCQPLNNVEIISVFSDGYARNFPKKSNKNLERMKYNPQMEVGAKEYKIPKESKTTQIFANNHKSGKYKHKKKDTTLRFPTVNINFNSVKGGHHPTQKPVALMEYLIKTYTNEGDTVLDFTMGSGTTGVACRNLNRKFVGIELDENYFAIAKDRILNS